MKIQIPDIEILKDNKIYAFYEQHGKEFRLTSYYSIGIYKELSYKFFTFSELESANSKHHNLSEAKIKRIKGLHPGNLIHISNLGGYGAYNLVLKCLDEKSLVEIKALSEAQRNLRGLTASADSLIKELSNNPLFVKLQELNKKIALSNKKELDLRKSIFFTRSK